MARTKKEQNIEALVSESQNKTTEPKKSTAVSEPELLRPQTEPENLESADRTVPDTSDIEQPEPMLRQEPKTETEQDESESISEPNEQKDETENRSTASPARERKKSGKKHSGVKPIRILSIDEQRSVETEADKEKNDLIDLLESLRVGKILTGTIQGVERSSENRSMAVIYHGAFKIVIPAEEAVMPPEDFRDKNPDDVMHYLLTKRLGAEVDFIVKGIDQESNVAVASRLDAMKAKRKQYYFGTDKDNNNLLYAGQCAEARVVSVIRAGIFVDVFGLEVYIPLRELSYQRMMDATDNFRPGQRILVKILALDRTDKANIRLTASVKQSAENPYEKALRRYTVDNRYVGTVSMVDTNGVFVALDGGIDCLCSYPKRGRPPRGARVTVRILGINNESNRIWGAITHIASVR